MKTVSIAFTAAYNNLWVPLAGVLKERMGCRIIAICQTKSDKTWFRKKDNNKVVDSYVLTDCFNRGYGELKDSNENIYEKAQVFENRYGCVYPEIIQTDRHLGRGYSALGIGHPRSLLSQQASYIATIDYLNRIFEFWEAYYQEHAPDLAIGGGSGIIGKPFALVMHGKNVPFRTLSYAKYKNFFYWATDELASFPGVEHIYRELSKTGQAEAEDTKLWADLIHLSNYTRNLKRISPFKTARRLIMQILYHLYRRFKGIRTYGNYLLKDSLKSIVASDVQFARLRRLRMKTVQELKKLDFFFFPLQTEPETSMTSFSPEFNEQLAVIELISKALPSKYYLVVKEHPLAIGRRPSYLYRLLSQIPNVVLADVLENSLEIAREATAVVTISGTIGYEATIMGKPVIVFGNHNWHSFMENTIVVDSLLNIKSIVNRAITMNGFAERYRRQGQLFLKALIEASFSWDFDAISLDRKGDMEVKSDDLNKMAKALEKSLAF